MIMMITDLEEGSYLIALGTSASSKNIICTSCELGEDKRFKHWLDSQLVLVIYRD